MRFLLQGVRPLGRTCDYPNSKKKVLDLLLEGQNSLETIFQQLNTAVAQLEQVYQDAKRQVNRIPSEPDDPDDPDRPYNITINFDSLITQCQNLYDNFEILHNDFQQLSKDCQDLMKTMKGKI